MQDAQSYTNKILRYWGQSLTFRQLVNQLKLNKQALPVKTLPAQETLSDANSLGFTEHAWWAPYVLVHRERSEEYVVPFWIPIKHTEAGWVPVAMPWIVPAFAEAILKVAAADIEVAYAQEQPEDALESAFASGCRLIEGLALAPIEDKCAKAGYVRHSEQWLLSSSDDFLLQNLSSLTENTLIQSYVSPDCVASRAMQASENIALDADAHLAHLSKEPLSEDGRFALAHLLSLKEGELQSVQTPLGSDAFALIMSAMLSKMASSAISKAPSFQAAIVCNTEAQKENICQQLLKHTPNAWLPEGIPFLWRTPDTSSVIDAARLTQAKTHLLQRAQAEGFSEQTLEDLLARLHQDCLATHKLLKEAITQARSVQAVRLRHDRTHENKGGLDARWKILQSKDSELEKIYAQLAEAVVQWESEQPKGLKARLVRHLPFALSKRDRVWQFYEAHLQGLLPWKEDAYGGGAELLSALHTRLRSIRTERSKLHQQMVPLSEALAERATAEKQWIDWQKETCNGASGDFEFNLEDAGNPERLAQILDTTLRRQLAEQALRYWQVSFIHASMRAENKTDISKCAPVLVMTEKACRALSDTPSFDQLFILNAQQYLAAEMVPLLATAKRAIFMADALQSTPDYLLSRQEEEHHLLCVQLAADEMEVDELSARGLLLSAGNAFLLARANSAYKLESTYGAEAQSSLSLSSVQHSAAICDYLSEYYGFPLKTSLSKAVLYPSFAGVHVKGLCLQLVNRREAKAVSNWLDTNASLLQGTSAGKALDALVCIVTMTTEQATLIQQLCDRPVNVYTPETLPDNTYPIVLFSPVVTLGSPRPYPFDKEGGVLSQFVSRAEQSFIVIGDLDLFEQGTHSASGKLAKVLFKDKNYLLPGLSIPYEGIAGEKRSFTCFEALRSQIDQSVQKAKTSLVFFSPEIEIKTLEAWRLTGDFNKAKARGVHIKVIVSEQAFKAISHEKMIKIWAKAGVTFLTMPRLNTNGLVVDEQEYHEYPRSILKLDISDFPISETCFEGDKVNDLLSWLCRPIELKAQAQLISDKSEEKALDAV